MITGIYRGGVGNQLFQVATGYALGCRNNDTYYINPNAHIEIGQGRRINHYISNIFSNIPIMEVDISETYQEIEPYIFNKIEYRNNIKLDGYFQSDKYFKDYKKQICNLFVLPDIRVNINGKRKCVIHIRTGDYIGVSCFDIINPTYFKNAIDYIYSIDKDVNYFVVTDNEALISSFIPVGIHYTILHSDDEIQHLAEIASSDYAIISNSSFSWWGSYLGIDKITIAPSRWLNTPYDSIRDIYRDDMILINT